MRRATAGRKSMNKTSYRDYVVRGQVWYTVYPAIGYHDDRESGVGMLCVASRRVVPEVPVLLYCRQTLYFSHELISIAASFRRCSEASRGAEGSASRQKPRTLSLQAVSSP